MESVCYPWEEDCFTDRETIQSSNEVLLYALQFELYLIQIYQETVAEDGGWFKICCISNLIYVLVKKDQFWGHFISMFLMQESVNYLCTLV